MSTTDLKLHDPEDLAVNDRKVLQYQSLRNRYYRLEHNRHNQQQAQYHRHRPHHGAPEDLLQGHERVKDQDLHRTINWNRTALDYNA